MSRETQGIDPAILIAGALSVLASDALNGIVPNDSALYRLMAPYVPAAVARAEVQALVADIRRRAERLASLRSAHEVVAACQEELAL